MSQLFSLLLLLILIVGGVFFIMPLQENVKEVKADVNLKATELQTLQSELDELSALSKEVSKSDIKKKTLLAAVPAGYDQDELLLELTDLTVDQGYDVNAINFGLTNDPSYGKTISVTANFEGNYNDLISFLQKLESADRLFKVTSISVQRTSTSDVVFNLMIEAYYQ